MSQDQTCPALVATSSGLVLAGWVAWARRSPAIEFVRRIRCIVDIEHR